MNCNKTPETSASIYLNGCSCECLWNELHTYDSDMQQRKMSCNAGMNGSGDSGSENGMPADDFASWPLGMTYVPMQPWEEPFDLAKGLHAGTIFPSLRKPFRGGGC